MSESETGEYQSASSRGEGHRPASRGEPILRGVVKIDFNDAAAVDEFTAGLAAEIMQKVRESGIPLTGTGKARWVSIGGVPYAEYQETQDALHAEYQAILSFLPSSEEFGDDEFLQLLDAYIHRELEEERGAALDQSVAAVLAALEWGDIDLSGVVMETGFDVWDTAAISLIGFEHREIEDATPMLGLGNHVASAAMLDMGRGVTYLCFDSHPDIGIDDYEILAEVAPNDWKAVQRIGVEAMRYAAISGEPLGKWPDVISVSSPVTVDDVRETFRELFVSSEDVAVEYNEWMIDSGYEALPLGTDSERAALADAYLDLVLDEGA